MNAVFTFSDNTEVCNARTTSKQEVTYYFLFADNSGVGLVELV